MKRIIKLIESAFNEKRISGPFSQQFKDAQKSALEAIDKHCRINDNELIFTGDKSENGDEVAIRICKKFDGYEGCSYVLEMVRAIEIKEENPVRYPWPSGFNR